MGWELQTQAPSSQPSLIHLPSDSNIYHLCQPGSDPSNLGAPPFPPACLESPSLDTRIGMGLPALPIFLPRGKREGDKGRDKRVSTTDTRGETHTGRTEEEIAS